MEDTVLLYPAPTFHHLVSMVELGKLIPNHHQTKPPIPVTILVPSMPFDDPTTTSSYITHLSQSQPTISFIPLPPLPPSNPTQREDTFFHSIATNALHVLQTLQTSSSTSTILALITSAPHENLIKTHIPIYIYFTSCASVLSLFLHFPTIHNQTTKSFHHLNQTLFNIPGLPPIPASHMPQLILNRDTSSYRYFLSSVTSTMLKSKGVIVNTFDSLEPRAIEAITRGACVPDGPSPPVFPIGPLVSNTKDHVRTSRDEASRCLAWLDAQPRQSVVLLCFGSRGVFSGAQVREIALGLERSEQRFVWVVKSPQGLDKEPNLEELLPEGFMERTKERGLVVKCWVPQNAVLGHEAVGGFVTHCGWNSVVEAVSCGVPMVAWPLYAEQHVNSVVMVEEMKVAIAVREGTRGGLVGAEEVERSVRELMELEEGKGVRERCLEMKAMAEAALSFGGSSSTNFSKLLASWNHQ